MCTSRLSADWGLPALRRSPFNASPPMAFKIVLLAADADPSWPEKIRQAVPGVVVRAFSNPTEAHDEIVDADAAYGTVPPDLFARAKKLR